MRALVALKICLTTSALLGATTLFGAMTACAQIAPTRPGGGLDSAFESRAVESINAWMSSGVNDAWRHGFVPLQDLTVPVDDAGFTEATKIAYISGWYVLTAPLPLPPPSPGHIRFPDGTSMAVPLVNAEDAYRQLDQGDAPCQDQIMPTGPTAAAPDPTTPDPSTPDGVTGTSVSTPCINLTVTQINLGTVKIRTSRGQASVPAWLFTVAQLRAPIARVAVAPSAITAVPSVNNQSPGIAGLVSAQDLVSVNADTITFRLGVGSCDHDIKPLVYETANAIALAGSVRTTATVCDDMLKLQPETVTLNAPLGDRVILDALNGSPLTIRSWP